LKGGNNSTAYIPIIPLYDPTKKDTTSNITNPIINPFATNNEKTFYENRKGQTTTQPTQPTQPTQTTQPNQFPQPQIKPQQPPIQVGNNPIVNLQVYSQQKPPQEKLPPQVQPQYYINNVPSFVNPLSFAKNHQYNQQGLMPIIYKENNININGISGYHHQELSNLYENLLPVKDITNAFNNLDDRITLCEGIKSTLFPNGDGENTAIDKGSQTNVFNPTMDLLAHMKLIDLNPYSLKKYSNNPYGELPKGFLLYRSCYPIKHDPNKATSVCATGSTGVNVRVYKLIEGSYLAKKQNSQHVKNFDEWRDLSLYDYIRENILRKKICPNFVMLYGYTITLKSGIDFDTDLTQRAKMQNSYQQNMVQQQLKQHVISQQSQLYAYQQKLGLKPSNQPQLSVKEQLEQYTGKVVCAITEAPNYSILGWARKDYRSVGNIYSMVSSGYYSKNVWMSVLFQLFVAIYVMQLYGIYIDDFSLDRNVYIKDIATTTNKFWIYKIAGVEFYVPNLGYVVLIDTNFRDFEKDADLEKNKNTYEPSRKRKINGSFIDNSKDFKNDIFDNIFKKTIIDLDPFKQKDFTDNGGVKPPQEIDDLFKQIKTFANTDTDKKILPYFTKYFDLYLHNRVGTLLNEREVPYVKTGVIKNFKRGDLVPFEDGGIYRFVIFISESNDGKGQMTIISRDGNNVNSSNIIEKIVDKSKLEMYSVIDPIKQETTINSNFTSENLLATYNVI